MNKPYSLSNFFDEMINDRPVDHRLYRLQSMHEAFESSKNPYSTFAYYPRFRHFEDVAMSVISPVSSFFTLATYTAFSTIITAISTALTLIFLSAAAIFAMLHEDDVVNGALDSACAGVLTTVTGLASTVYLVFATLVSPLADVLSLLVRSFETVATKIEDCMKEDGIQTDENSFVCC